MRSKSPIVISLIFLLICSTISCCITAFAVSSYANDPNNQVKTEVLQDGDPTQTVAVIKVNGIISSTSTTDLFGNEYPDMTTTIIRQINHAQNDENVKAILLDVNSPGGEAYASKQIYNRLIDFKESEKPIVVIMRDTAASGAYYLSLPADKIVASPITTTGSIGVIVTGTDLTGLYEKVGIEEFNVVNSDGNLKVLNNLNQVDSEGYKLLQSILDDVYNDFLEAVATNRNLPLETARTLADGRIYSGKQAYENKLIDNLGEDEVAREVVSELASLSEPNFVLYSDTLDTLSIYSLSISNLIFPELTIVSNKTPGIAVNFLMPI